MPRRIAGGDGRASRHRPSAPTGFNDAPANCRGRPLAPYPVGTMPKQLQRCPGELPGETGLGIGFFTDLPRTGAASTMPRRIAGGDDYDNGAISYLYSGLQRCPGELPGETAVLKNFCASASGLQRCPGELPGETYPGCLTITALCRASTMPRRIAGGDRPAALRASRERRCFNDAPANCRGRLHTWPRWARAMAASTMPRRIAGGDSMAPTHCLPMRDSTNCERCRNIAWPAARATGSGLQIVKEHDALQ